jgi:hypothetical protein
MLLVPAWELSQKPGKSAQVRLYGQLADIYENYLGKPEYALRARIAAWKLNAAGVTDLPPRSGDLSPQHEKLWKLAEAAGSYAAPPAPRDPLLWPILSPPELADLTHWHKVGLDPISFAALSTSPVGETSETAELPREQTKIVDVSEVEELEEARLTGEINLSPEEKAALFPKREQIRS